MPKAKPEQSATSENPAYPDADPTAPGGMSRKALAMELRERHGWTPKEIRETFPDMKDWPRLIEQVITERRAREAEQRCETHEQINCADCNGVAKAHEESLADETLDAEQMFGDMPAEVDETEDPEALMAELLSAREEAESEPIQYGLLTRLPGVLDYIFDGHMGAGPSASERWLHCTASLGASREFLETLTPNQQQQYAQSSQAARQGTTAHAAAEAEALTILGRLDQSELDLTLLELAAMPENGGEAYDDEMGEYITEYVDLVRTYAQDRGDDHVLIEQTVSAAVPLTQALPDGEDVYEITGSGDCVVLPTPEEPTLVVGDLKYGDGIDVEVDENPQVRIYALGALSLLVDDEGNLITPVEDVTYHIAQPRLGGVKTWTEPLADLLQWRDEVLSPRLTAALLGPAAGATFAPSESACQFCPARGGCAALAEDRLTRAADLFDVVVEAEFEGGPGAFPETATLTDTRLGELLSQVKGLISIYEDLKEEAQRRLYRGDSVPGWGLVNYSPPRKWSEEAEEALADIEELWVRKPITPKQALVLAKKHDDWDAEALESLIVTPDKRPVVAPEGDRRSKWTGRPPEQMFDALDDDEEVK